MTLKNRFTAKTSLKAAGISSYEVITRPNPGFRDTADLYQKHCSAHRDTFTPTIESQCSARKQHFKVMQCFSLSLYLPAGLS